MKDDLHVAPDRRDITGINEIPVEFYTTFGWRAEAQNRPASRRFTATRFANQTDRLALAHRKGDIVDGAHIDALRLQTLAQRNLEILLQPVDFQ